MNESGEIESSILFGSSGSTDAAIMITNTMSGNKAIGGMTNKQIYNPSRNDFDSVVLELNDQN